MSLRKFSLSLVTASVVLAGCGKDSNDATEFYPAQDKTPPAPAEVPTVQGPMTAADYPVPSQLTELEEKNVVWASASATESKGSSTSAETPVVTSAATGLTAEITRTQFGVPHIKADSLQELSFGAGYAFAEDNHCILIDQITKAKGERSLYFGPHVDGTAPNQFGIEGFGPGDFLNIISDFSFKALGSMEAAEEKYASLSAQTRAMLEGYTTGFNHYLASMAQANITNPQALALGGLEAVVGSGAVNALAAECRNMPNAMAEIGESLQGGGITPQELIAYSMTVLMRASGANSSIQQLALLANPGEAGEFLFRTPFDQASGESAPAKLGKSTVEYQKFAIDHGSMGSNGWGLGSERTDNGKGALLANPHFPHTGALRFYQSHLQLKDPDGDGYLMNVTGGSLAGMPGLVNIGFNDNVAWTHTVSTAEHFIVYALDINPDDETRMSYMVDGQVKNIEKKEITVMVSMPNPATGVIEAFPFTKDYFHSEQGLMLETPVEVLGAAAPFKWTASQAFTLKDMNENNVDLVDQWLAMNLASNLDEFQAAMKKYDGVSFVNTIYADKEGNSFYMDDSTVAWLDPLLTGQLDVGQAKELRETAGFTILPGNSEFYHVIGPMPYDFAPKTVSSTYVQNSNDSHWASAPDLLPKMEETLNKGQNVGLLGKSRLYGTELTKLSRRTRMGLAMLNQPVFSGGDTKFSLTELAQAQLNNMSLLPIIMGAELGAQCTAQITAELTAMAQGATAGVNVTLASGETQEVSLIDACVMIGGYLQSNVHPELGALPPMSNTDVRGVALFRELAYQLDDDKHFTIPFTQEALSADPTNAVSLPAGLITDGSVMQALAIAKLNLMAADQFALSDGQGGYVTTMVELAPGVTLPIPVAPTLGDVQFKQSVSPLPAELSSLAPSVVGLPGNRYPWAGSTHTEGGFNVYSGGFWGDDSLMARMVLDPAAGTLDASYNTVADAVTGSNARSGLSKQGYRVTNGGSWMMVMQFTDEGPVGLGVTTFSQSTHSASPHFEDQTAAYSSAPTGILRPIVFTDAQIAGSAISTMTVSN